MCGQNAQFPIVTPGSVCRRWALKGSIVHGRYHYVFYNSLLTSIQIVKAVYINSFRSLSYDRSQPLPQQVPNRIWSSASSFSIL
jgi:hypothetical protein